MAKPRVPRTRTATTSPVPTAEATQAAHRRTFLDLGKRVLRAMQSGGGRKPASRAVAAETGRGAILARKASLFVERYTPEQIARLETARTSAGKPIGVAMLAALSAVDDAARRQALVAEVEAGRHSSATLEKAVPGPASGPRTRGGPRRRPPNSLGEGLEQIRDATREWLDRHERAWEAGAWLATPGAGLDPDDPPSLLTDVRTQLKALARAARQLEKRLARQGGGEPGTLSSEAHTPPGD